MINKKLKEWLKRYWLAEVIGLIMSVVIGNLGLFLFRNKIVAAICATWAENLGYYGTILRKEVAARKKKDKKHTAKGIFKVLRNIAIEFGPSEYLDSFLIRPFYLATLPYFISNYSLALIIGNILANITFYLPTILSYEARKKMLKE